MATLRAKRPPSNARPATWKKGYTVFPPAETLRRIESEYPSQKRDCEDLAREINAALLALYEIHNKWLSPNIDATRRRVLTSARLGREGDKWFGDAIDAARVALGEVGANLAVMFELVDVWSVGAKGHPVDQLLRTQINHLTLECRSPEEISAAFTSTGRAVSPAAVRSQIRRSLSDGRNPFGLADLAPPFELTPRMRAKIASERAKAAKRPKSQPKTKRPARGKP